MIKGRATNPIGGGYNGISIIAVPRLMALSTRNILLSIY